METFSQKATWKDVEWCFGVLQTQFGILANVSNLGNHNWHLDGLYNVAQCDNKKRAKFEIRTIIGCEKEHNI